MHIDYIICGHGIAGAVLAHTLVQQGKSVLVYDADLPYSASKAAAGMWNPVSFKNLKLTWRANEFLSEAATFYHSIEEQSGTRFFHPKEMSRLFHSTADVNEWDTRSTSESLLGHLSSDTENKLPDSVHQPFGYGVVKTTGWLNIPEFLDVSKNLLGDNYKAEAFDYSKLQLNEDHILYDHVEAQKVIFCEGYRITTNPWFSYLPVEPNKGQVQTLKGSFDTSDRIFHFGKFMLPLGNNLFRFGATYEFNDPDPHPTAISSELMQRELKEVCSEEFELVDEKTGYRPTLPDRKPLLGLHPTHSQFGVFNGMGSRGVIMSPLCAKHYIHFLEGRSDLDPSMNIARYQRFFH